MRRISNRKLRERILESNPLINEDEPFLFVLLRMTTLDFRMYQMLHESSPTLRKNLEEWVNRKPLSDIAIDGHNVKEVMDHYEKLDPFTNDGELFIEAFLALSDYEMSGDTRETRRFPPVFVDYQPILNVSKEEMQRSREKWEKRQAKKKMLEEKKRQAKKERLPVIQ